MANVEQKTYRIAIDAMGGDFAPNNEVLGAIKAYQEKKANSNFEVVFIGNEPKIRAAIAQSDPGNLNYSIVHADDVITMEDDPTEILKKKTNSSLHKGLSLHSQGYADAFLSVGNTGAVLTAATVLLGRIKGASRPTIGSFFPTQGGYPVFVLDVGANIDSKPKFLYEFAVMGSIFVTQTLGIENPRIGLLNIGEEASKGTDTLLQTYELLKASHLNFIGNVEGRDILLGSVDVVVCDGYVGNVVLKFAESFAGLLKNKIKSFASGSLLNKISIALFLPILKRIFKEFDYQEYGGVPLLGVNGVVLIGHGKSTPKAISKMILKAVDIVNQDVNKKIENALNPPIFTEKSK